MCLKLLAIFTGKGDIIEVVVFAKAPKRTFDIFLKVIPLKTKLFSHCKFFKSKIVLNILFTVTAVTKLQQLVTAWSFTNKVERG